jgi:hypothetical protein
VIGHLEILSMTCCRVQPQEMACGYLKEQPRKKHQETMQAAGKRMARSHHGIGGALMAQPASVKQRIRLPMVKWQVHFEMKSRTRREC